MILPVPGRCWAQTWSTQYIFLLPTGSLCSVSIEKALPEDRGLYKCVAKNSAGQAESSCQVTVDGRWCPPNTAPHRVPLISAHRPSTDLPPKRPSPPEAFSSWMRNHLLQDETGRETAALLDGSSWPCSPALSWEEGCSPCGPPPRS